MNDCLKNNDYKLKNVADPLDMFMRAGDLPRHVDEVDCIVTNLVVAEIIEELADTIMPEAWTAHCPADRMCVLSLCLSTVLTLVHVRFHDLFPRDPQGF